MPKIPEKRSRLRLWITLALAALAFASSAWAAKTVRGFLSTDPRFTLHDPRFTFYNPAAVVRSSATAKSISIVGATYSSVGSVQQVFNQDYGRSVFQIPLAERRRRLLAIDWIEDAAVSRIWPNRLLIHVRERKPVAFVNVPHQAFLLIDSEGVLLSPPPRANFEFPIISGVWVDQSEPDRKLRVQAALHLLDDLGPAAKDVSEINAASPDDLRITTGVQGRAFELEMGDANFAPRYRNFIDHFSDIHAGSPRATVFDLRIDDRITAR